MMMQSRNNHSLLALALASTTLMSAALPIAVSAAQTTHTCTPTEVATFPERLHVRCSTAAGGGIVFFAVPTTNHEHAARILSSLLSAHMARRTLVIGYDTTDTSGTAFGCAQNDCRRLLYVRVL